MFVRLRQKFLLNNIAKYSRQRKCSTSAVTKVENEAKDTEEVVYPTIYDVSYKATRQRTKQAWHDAVKNLETVEEKLFKLNMPRYYGWKVILLKEDVVPYDCLRHAQYITKTHVMKESGLPTYYNNIILPEELDSIVQAIKSNIEDNVIFEYCNRRRDHEVKDKSSEYEMKDNISKSLIERINRTILSHLSLKYPHLLHSEVAFAPRLEACWFIGIEPHANIRKIREKSAIYSTYVDEPTDFPVQYIGEPVVHLRHKHPLREIIPLSECENPDFDVPTYKFYPKTLNHLLARRHVTTMPGFWPGDQSEFGLLSYHNCAYLQNRPKTYNDTSEAITVQAIFASYSWLLSQACYQGFSTYNDVTYPLTTQTVITDGQLWSFCVYQLNTTLVHSEQIDENPKRNICWITEPVMLFEKIENEKVHGLNEEVLKTLIKFYVNAPEQRVGVNMKPYLGESVKVIADIKEDERRNWLEKYYKHLVSNRPRHRRMPEIYHWEKLYLIDHETRPMYTQREKIRKKGVNFFRRKLDDHHPAYVPKHLREYPKLKKVGRWQKTYYP